MTPSAPWNGHRQDAAQRGQRSPHLGVLHEISEVFIGREAEPRRSTIDHRVHRIRERPPPRRDRDDDEDLDALLRKRDPEYRVQGLRHPGVLGAGDDRGKWRARKAQQGNAGGAEEKRGPDLGGRTGPLAGGDHEPQYQQRGRDRCCSDSGRKGCKKVHRNSRYAIFLHYPLLETRRMRPQVAGGHVPEPGPAASAAQHPLQIFFSFAFTRRSSALIESTYFAASLWNAEARRMRLASRTTENRSVVSARAERLAFDIDLQSGDDRGPAQRKQRRRQGISCQPLDSADGTRPGVSGEALITQLNQ